MDNGDIALYGRIEYVKAYEADDTAKANEFAKLTKVQNNTFPNGHFFITEKTRGISANADTWKQHQEPIKIRAFILSSQL